MSINESLVSLPDMVCTDEECDNRFSNEEQMKNHLLRVNMSESDLVNCGWPGCDYRDALDNLWQHQFLHQFKSRFEPFVCKYADCGKTFNSEQYLMEHMNDVHN